MSEHLAGLVRRRRSARSDSAVASREADAALAAYDVAGMPPSATRLASRVASWRVGAVAVHPPRAAAAADGVGAVAGGPPRDVEKFRDELLWQEFARHWYARLGVRHAPRRPPRTRRWCRHRRRSTGWDRSMACMASTVGELERDGWLVNQTRMWLASDWSVRNGHRWQDGEDRFFTHLLDGSRAANRLGWQWTTGVGSSKHYGFSRWQVEKRAPASVSRLRTPRRLSDRGVAVRPRLRHRRAGCCSQGRRRRCARPGRSPRRRRRR